MPNSEITAAGQRVFELFAACAGSPDDIEVGRDADAALRDLDMVLAAAADDS
jgi:hypothetical protein